MVSLSKIVRLFLKKNNEKEILFICSRDLQYNEKDVSCISEGDYSIKIPRVLPSEICEMNFDVGKTGVKIFSNCDVEIDERKSFSHPKDEERCYISTSLKILRRKTCGSIINEDVAVIDLLNPDNYYHWVTNDFPRILLCHNAGFKKIIISNNAWIDIHNLKPFQKEFLERLDELSFSKIDQIKNKTFSKICVPILPDEYYGDEKIGNCYIHEFYIHRVTKYVLNNIPKLFLENSKKNDLLLKIQRRDQEAREPRNSSDFNDFLVNKYGFKIIYLEDYSVEEQFQLMRESKIVIGAHGAGLVNFISANEKSVLIEYGAADFYEKMDNGNNKKSIKTKNYFHFLCELKGNDYYYIPVVESKIDLCKVDVLIKKLV